MHRKLPEQCQDYNGFSVKEHCTLHFQPSCTTSRTIYLKKWSRILDCLLLKLTIYWLNIRHFALFLLPWTSSLALVSTTSDICCWPNLFQEGLATTSSFKQCSPAFRGNLEEEVPSQGKSMDTKLEVWPGLKFCILWWARDTNMHLIHRMERWLY